MELVQRNSGPGPPTSNGWNGPIVGPPVQFQMEPSFSKDQPGPSAFPFVPNPNNADEVYAWAHSLNISRSSVHREAERQRLDTHKKDDSRRYNRQSSRSRSPSLRRRRSPRSSYFPDVKDSYSSHSRGSARSYRSRERSPRSKSKDTRRSEMSPKYQRRSARSPSIKRRQVKSPDNKRKSDRSPEHKRRPVISPDIKRKSEKSPDHKRRSDISPDHKRRSEKPPNYQRRSEKSWDYKRSAPNSKKDDSSSRKSQSLKRSPSHSRRNDRDSAREQSSSTLDGKRKRSPYRRSYTNSYPRKSRSRSKTRRDDRRSDRPRESLEDRNGREKPRSSMNDKERQNSRSIGSGATSSGVFSDVSEKTVKSPSGLVQKGAGSGSKVPMSKGQVEYHLAFLKDDETEEAEPVLAWTRSAPDDLYYERQSNGDMSGTARTIQLCQKFQTNLVDKPRNLRLEAEALGAAKMKEIVDKEREAREVDSDESESGTDESSDDESGASRSDKVNEELKRRQKHPRRLHEELWHNDPGLMNDGPVCRCSAKARRFGIRHGFYPGEEKILPCDPFSNNSERLYHYRITITPLNNFVVNKSTVIQHDGHDYTFEGFSLLSHYVIPLHALPPCSVIRFNIRYDVSVESEKLLESFCVKELDLFENYLFKEVLELVDLKLGLDAPDTCPNFHIFPRFVRKLPDNGKEVLSMSRVLLHLLKSDKDLMKEEDLSNLYTVEQTEWQNVADLHKGTIVTKWGMKPAALRVDQIDRDVDGHEEIGEEGIPFPLIVHFGIRPPQLSYAGNAGYQRAWRCYVKYRHLLSNMSKPSADDKRKLLVKELKLQEMRTASSMKRDVTIAISSRGFRSTGICCDIIQHAMLVPVLIGHLRFHKSLSHLENKMEYYFTTPYLLQLALTHPSYRENFGTNPDHARNSLTNCGIRQPEYGDRKIHYASTRKRGINTLINIMAKFGELQETQSEITHNERLEFLGDAVVEFVSSIHLFHLFPDLEEGGLATYRAAIVQNQHLAVLAQTLKLDQFMLYAHGTDLCHDSELRHAMANCLEALMGAIFLDGGIMEADRVFGNTLFDDDSTLGTLWKHYPKHPLQTQEPTGDREWIKSHTALKKLQEFEESIGVEFTHIRLLARAFTDRSLGYNNLSQGSNQRLEFLGDTVLQLISSEYLYRFFPDHHEGHLSLLRSSLVNNRTQSLVCDDLNMPAFAMRGDPKTEMKTKDRADLLEAFLGSLYVDKGLGHCIVFCQVCFIPRLTKSIVKQEWNDPKSKLQQCCLTLRSMNGREPDIPVYKVIECLGPTNTRIYVVAVYFRGRRLACGGGHSIQDAEMNAANTALERSRELFPQLNHQKRVMDKTSRSVR